MLNPLFFLREFNYINMFINTKNYYLVVDSEKNSFIEWYEFYYFFLTQEAGKPSISFIMQHFYWIHNMEPTLRNISF